MRFRVRPARTDEALDISRVVLAALHETSTEDYSQDIKRVEQSFDPVAVLELIASRMMFVAISDERIIGTASLDGRVVRAVFVSPDVQGQGVGRLLMGQLEDTARKAGIEVLYRPA